ncbi:MAG: ComEC/Rec2 family competence protein [Anaerolineae bacterium]
MRLIAIAIGWVAGVFLASVTKIYSPFPWLVLSAAFMLVTALLWSGRVYRNLALALLALALGGLRYTGVPLNSEIAQYNNLGGMTIEGTVVAEPDVRDDRVDLRLQSEAVTRIGTTVPTQGLVLIQAPAGTSIGYGDHIAVTGELVLPSESDTFSYRDYLARSGVFSIMRDASVQIIDSGQSKTLLRVLFDLKDRARQFISRSLPEPSAGLLTGILLGDERGLSPEISEAFSKVGASHIIAISGFNMAILSAVVLRLLARAHVRPRPAAIIALSVLVTYTILVGATPSVVRAAIMSSVLVVGDLMRRKSYVPTSLAFVALVISVINPNILWDVGFQLSFFATLGLALFATPLTQWLNTRLNAWFPPTIAVGTGEILGEALMVSIAAQIMTLPLILLYFERLSIVALLVNLLIIPVQSYLMVIGLAATLIAFAFLPLAQLLFWLDMLLLGWTLAIVREFARLPFADTAFKVDSRLISGFYLVTIGGALMLATKPNWSYRLATFIRRRIVLTTLGLCATAIALLFVALFISRPDGKLHIWWLDVGHSNAVLIQTPAGAHILVDGGRLPSRLLTAIGDRLPFNTSQLDLLVIAQPDPFDYGALSNVLDRYAVQQLLTNGQPNLNPDYQALLARISPENQMAVTNGYTVNIDDSTYLEVLYPQHPPQITDKLNDSALTLRLTYRSITFLLPSDLSTNSQLDMLKHGEWPLATVMQLPNHAGIRSLAADFLASVQPQAVIVQTDITNRLGDPDPDTLSLLGDIPIFRTDQYGTLHFWTDGNRLWASGSK